MDAKWKQSSIQTRLVTLLVIAFLPVLVLQSWIYYDRYRTRYNNELQANIELARSMGKGFNAFVQGVLHTALAIGISATSSPPLSSTDFNRLLERCADNALGVEIFSWIGTDGRVLASSFSEAVGVNVSDRPYYAAILSGSEWAVGDLVLSKTTGKPVFTINRAIRDQDGNLLGIVTAGVFSDGLKDVLPLDRLGDAGVSLLDSKGVLVYRYPDLDYTWAERNWIGFYPAIENALKGKDVTTTIESQKTGVRRLVGFAPIAPMNWVAGASRSEDEVMRIVFSGLAYHMLFFISAAFIAFVVALALSRRIANPIQKLRAQALAIGEGGDENLAVGSGPVEILELSESFKDMAGKVSIREDALRASEARFRTLAEELERKVGERTAELKCRLDELRHANEQLKTLAGKLARAEQDERKRLANLLHDGLQQLLASAKLRLGALIDLDDQANLKLTVEDIDRLLNESIQISRSLSAELCPKMLYEFGLSDALPWLARWMREKHGLVVELALEEKPELSEDVKVFLFLAVREMLFNTAKHAGINSAHICMQRVEAGLMVTVSDDGRGFDPTPAKLGEDTGGFGLFSINERIGLIGGRLDIDSAPGKGSRLSMTVPYSPAA